MTKVIGSQNDVPDIGDPIVSPWYQDTARKIVHVFTTTTARDAWVSPPDGAVCEAPAGVWWNRVAGVWVPLSGGFIRKGSTPGGDAPVGGVRPGVASISLPAGTFQLSYCVLVSTTAPLRIGFKVFVLGAVVFGYTIQSADAVRSAGFTIPVTLASAGVVQIDLENTGTQIVSCFADATNHLISAIQSSSTVLIIS